jgi:hypothetical protein
MIVRRLLLVLGLGSGLLVGYAGLGVLVAWSFAQVQDVTWRDGGLHASP